MFMLRTLHNKGINKTFVYLLIKHFRFEIFSLMKNEIFTIFFDLCKITIYKKLFESKRSDDPNCTGAKNASGQKMANISNIQI